MFYKNTIHCNSSTITTKKIKYDININIATGEETHEK